MGAWEGKEGTYLTGHGELVADLRLAGSELAVQLRDASRLDPSCKSLVQLPSEPLSVSWYGPPRMLSSAVEPVVMVMRSARRAWLERSRGQRGASARRRWQRTTRWQS